MNRETYDQFATFEYQGRTLTLAPRYVLIEHEGVVHSPDARPGQSAWAFEWEDLTPEAADERRAIVAHGTFWRDATRLSPAHTKFERAKILRKYADRLSAFASPPSGAVRFYIPGLWHHQSAPMLGGPPKVGKSLLVCDLVASLVIVGRKFLDHFDPVNVTPEERRRPVVLVNAENPEADMHAALLATGLEYQADGEPHPYYFDPEDETGPPLFVVHLEASGGADTFDLTRQDVYDRWEYELLELTREAGCPLTVIVDGVTAILNSDTTRYGRWYSEFRRLLKSVDVPNGLPTGHTGMKSGYLMNGVESMAGQDGLWTYDAIEPYVNPGAQRRFQTVPRLHAPAIKPTPVVMGADGRLRLGSPRTANDRTRETQTSLDEKRQFLRDRIASLTASQDDAWTNKVCGTGEAYTELAAVLRQMEQDGEVRKEPKGRGVIWSLCTTEPN